MSDTKTKKLPAHVQWCIDEAHRRWQLFGHNYGNDITKAWIGLGYPNEYKQAVAMGLMRPTREKLIPRVLGWYVFTDAGVEEYQRQHPAPATSTKEDESEEYPDPRAYPLADNH